MRTPTFLVDPVVRGVTVILLAAAAILFPMFAHAQAPRSAAIILRKGPDTLVVERITRGAATATGRIAVRGQPSVEVRMQLGPGHTVPSMSFAVRGAGAAPDAAPLQSGTLTFAGDSAFLEIKTGAGPQSLRRATRPGALPVLNNDFLFFEQAVRQARAKGVTSMTVPLFALNGAVTIDGKVDLVGSDSARFTILTNVTEASVDADGNVTGGRIAAQGIDISVVTGAAANAVTLGRPDYSAPAGAPYTAEDVTVTTPAGHVLTGTLTRPVMNALTPAVVTITGSGAQDRDEFIPFSGGIRPFRQVADTLSRRGIAVLRLDDRGINGSGGDVNGTTADFADDIRAAVAYLRSRPDIDGARIALVGHSEGGAIAPLVAASDPKLAAIVLMAGPAYTGEAIITYQIANLVRGDTTIAPARRDSATRVARAQFDSTAGKSAWMKWFLAYDPLPTIRKVRQPVLILQGATDQQVRPEEATMLDKELRAAGNRSVTLRIFPERNHLFIRDPIGHPSGYERLSSNRIDGEVLGTLTDWLVATLRVR